MKKVIYLSAMILLTGVIMVSCGKTTKQKMDGDWKIDLYTTTYESINYTDEEVYNEKEEYKGNNYSYQWSGYSDEHYTANVKEATWSINKDGTWKRVLDLENFSEEGIQARRVEYSGTWDFLSGGGEFKKNERIGFSVTGYKAVYDLFETYEDTYAKGVIFAIMTVVESKKNSLKMELKQNYTYSNKMFVYNEQVDNSNHKTVTSEYVELSK